MASASQSALILSPCLRSFWDQARQFEDRLADTTKRDKGTDFHAGIDVYYKGLALNCDFPEKVWSPRFLETPGWVTAAIEWSKAILEPRCKEIHSEVYVAYNFTTGEVHTDQSVCNRQYPDKSGFLPGTADLVCVLTDESLLVADWKTGGGSGADKQLLSLASGLRKVYTKADGSLRSVRLAVLYAGDAAHDAGVFPSEWEVAESDIQAHEHAMAFQLADIGVRTDPVPGIHCTQMYCKHLAYCPAITGEVVKAGVKLLHPDSLMGKKAMKGTYQMTDSPESDEHAGYVGAVIAAAKRQLEYYNNGLRKYADDGGHIVAGDMELKQTNSGFRWVKRGN